MDDKDKKLQGLEKLLKVFDSSKIITSEEIEQVLEGIVGILETFKSSVTSLNTETKESLSDTLQKMMDEHNEIVRQTSVINENTKDAISKEVKEAIKESDNRVKELIDEVKTWIPQDGKDADPNEVVALVLEKIKFPEQKETILDTPDEIRDKLKSLKKDDRLPISAIKGTDELRDEIVRHTNDQARGILYAGLLENASSGGGTGSGAQGATGPAGPQGTQGSQGSIGIQGATGNDGAKGATGNDGSRGSQGSQGTQGSLGATGAQGATGNQGTQGTQGSLGATGAQGATGNQGTQGTAGSRGSQGTQGTQGSLGPTGATGAQGTQGSIGLQGTQGSQGSVGVQGTQGSIGATGGTGFVTPRSTATGSTLSPTPNADTTDVYALTAQAGTAAFQATSGTPVEGQKLIIKIRGTGPTQNITWTGGTGGYTAGGVALPTSTVNFKVITVGFMYDTSNNINRWMCVAVATQV